MDKSKDQTYSQIFEQNSATKNVYNTIIIVLLFSLISGSIGYFFGVSGFSKRIQDAFSIATSQNTTTDGTAKVYTADEIASKIDQNQYDFNTYYQIIGNLKDKYVDQSQVTDEKLFDGTLKGLVASIGDAPTVYMNKDDYKKYRESFSGTFEGIGVRLEYDNNKVIISDVLENSPAKEAGLQQGYIFVEVDGKNVQSLTIDDVVNAVRGQSGSKVKIKFHDPVTNKDIEKEITRAPISVESMRLVPKDSDTVVIEISRFTEDSLDKWTSKWDATVKEIQSKGYKNVILDLRGNPGGYLEAAVYAANDFLKPGSLVLTERSRDKGDVKKTTTNQNPRLADKNLVILVNSGTASAAEILSGALKFDAGVKVIGTKTYGKGTVQETYTLQNGGALKITTEYWLLPDGKKLDHDNPIKPDIEIQQDQEKLRNGEDNVMNEALKQVKSK